ncbi:uncharacterized protein LOC144128602 [Amblyomma americanum]
MPHLRFPLQAACPRGLSSRVRGAVLITVASAFILLVLRSHHRLRTAPDVARHEDLQVNVHAIRSHSGRRGITAVPQKVVEEQRLATAPSEVRKKAAWLEALGADKRFIINTVQCRIPNLDPLDPSIAPFVKKAEVVDCSKDFPNLTFTKDTRLHINMPILPHLLQHSRAEQFHCCFRPFFRNVKPQSDDDNVFQMECIPFQDGMEVPHEFVKVECYNGDVLFYANYHAFIHPKKSYQRRFKEYFKPEHRGYQYSVLIVGVDSVSRLNAHRQFPETVRFLKERMGAVEMYGYTKVGDNTFPNLVPLLTGLTERELAFGVWTESDYLDSLPMLWKAFAANGWSTLYAEDNPELSTFNYFKQGFLRQPTDYYFRPFLSIYEREAGHRKPLNCHQCVGAQSETEVVLQWLRSYKELMLKWPSFAFVWLNSATHDDFNGGYQVDHIHRSFFEALHAGAYLQNTVVIFMSDHGHRWSPVRETHSGMFEDRLPALFISFPPTFRRHHPDIMRTIHINARRLTTPFDLHTTLASLVNFDGKPRPLDLDDYPEHLHGAVLDRAINLFREVPQNRTCEEAFIDEQWCACRESAAEDPGSEAVARVASFLVASINGIIAPYKSLCAVLKVSAVKSARVFLRHANASSLDYLLHLETSPGGALFETTVRTYNDGRPSELLGDVSRLNLYKGQADCVQSASIKKFCFCTSRGNEPP